MLITGIKSKPVYAPLRADTGGRYHLMLGFGPGVVPLLRVLSELESAVPHALEHTRVLMVPEDSQPLSIRFVSTHSTSVQSSSTEPSPAQPGPTQSSSIHSGSPEPGPAQSGPTQSISTESGPVPPGPTLPESLQPAEFIARLGLQAVTLFDGAAALLRTFRIVLEESLMGTRLYVAGPESFIGLAMQIALQFDLNKDEIRAEEVGTLARRVHCVHCRATRENVRTNIVRCTGCDRWLLVRDHYSRRLAAYMGVMVDAEVPGELPAIHEVYL
jgi:hypothetical protein